MTFFLQHSNKRTPPGERSEPLCTSSTEVSGWSKKKKEVEEQTLKTDLKPVMLVEVMDMFFKFHESTLEKQKIQDTEMFKGLMDRMFCYQQQQIQQLHPVQK
jgi:hypothetical protein